MAGHCPASRSAFTPVSLNGEHTYCVAPGGMTSGMPLECEFYRRSGVSVLTIVSSRLAMCDTLGDLLPAYSHQSIVDDDRGVLTG